MRNVWQVRQRAELGSNSDISIGFRHDGRLAGERVANNKQLAIRAHQECIEAIQFAEAALHGALQAVALAQSPFEESAGRLGVIIGLEADAQRFQFLAHQMRIGQRSVVHQTKVPSRSEGMRVCRRHGRLGRHARMAYQMRTLQGRKPVAFGDVCGRTDVLVQFD